MNRGNLDPDFVIAQALKISLLRLAAHTRGQSAELHPDDVRFGEAALVLALARLDNRYSRAALLDLMEFVLADYIWDDIGEAMMGRFGESLIPDIKARIGKERCAQARRKSPYLESKSKKSRDRGLRNILFERDFIRRHEGSLARAQPGPKPRLRSRATTSSGKRSRRQRRSS
jgi:hypothetical protein